MVAKPRLEGTTDGPAGPILPQPRLPRTGATRTRQYPRPQPQGASIPLHHLWPQTALGLACLGVLAATVPAAIPYALIIAVGGWALSIPLAVITASPVLGRAMTRVGLCRLPEETDPPPALRALALPAVLAATKQA